MNLDAPYTRLVSGEDVPAGTGAKVPDTEGGVTRAGDGNRLAGHFEAADG